MGKIDPKLLKGLKFHSNEVKEVVEDGRKVNKYFPTERELTPDDVLSSKNYGDKIVIVTADGRKYDLPLPTGQAGKPEKGDREIER